MTAVEQANGLLERIGEKPVSRVSSPMPRAKLICLCTPTLGMVSVQWHQAMCHLAWPMNTTKAPMLLIDDKPEHLRTGNEIAEARNFLVAKAMAMKTDERYVSHLFWVDDDVIVTSNALECLLRHDRDIAAGVYFLKAEFPSPLMFPSRGGGVGTFEPDKLVECWGCGMGLTLVKMGVYERMLKELDLGRDCNGNPEWYKTKGQADDGVTTENGVMFCGGTEDLYFCELASRLGINPLMDCGKWAFGFHYDAKRRMGYPQEQWKQRQACQPVVWPDGTKWE